MVFLGATNSFVILTVDRLIIFSLDERILVNRSNEVRKEVDFNAVSVELPSFAMFPENTSKMRRRVLSLFRSFYLLSKRRRKREPSRERKKKWKKSPMLPASSRYENICGINKIFSSRMSNVIKSLSHPLQISLPLYIPNAVRDTVDRSIVRSVDSRSVERTRLVHEFSLMHLLYAPPRELIPDISAQVSEAKRSAFVSRDTYVRWSAEESHESKRHTLGRLKIYFKIGDLRTRSFVRKCEKSCFYLS
uniref:Uncharacterized protein n=1 Tax=Vespula pensylvanica TaxID=30213 RepID=A0A834K1D2_VESPE|nr:hypothetical protein H0235_016361 [Vespula pensylvanica]